MKPKRIVQATGSFMLMDPMTHDLVVEERPTVVTWSTFFEARTGAGQIKVLATDVPDEATDTDLEAFLRDAGNVELGLAAFLSQFSPEAQMEARAPKRSTKGRKPAAEGN